MIWKGIQELSDIKINLLLQVQVFSRSVESSGNESRRILEMKRPSNWPEAVLATVKHSEWDEFLVRELSWWWWKLSWLSKCITCVEFTWFRRPLRDGQSLVICEYLQFSYFSLTVWWNLETFQIQVIQHRRLLRMWERNFSSESSC